MRIDPAVTREKFAAERQILRQQDATLREWGCWLVHDEFPTFDLVLLPRTPLAFSFEVQQNGPLFLGPRAAVISGSLPMLAARAVGIRIALDDYDIRAPSVTFRDPWTWALIPYEELLRGQTSEGPGKPLLNVILGPYGDVKHPFLCLRGVREYHEHPQHTGDDWMLYRANTTVFALVQKMWRILVRELRAHLIVGPRPQGLGIEVRWETEQKTK